MVEVEHGWRAEFVACMKRSGSVASWERIRRPLYVGPAGQIHSAGGFAATPDEVKLWITSHLNTHCTENEMKKIKVGSILCPGFLLVAKYIKTLTHYLFYIQMILF